MYGTNRSTQGPRPPRMTIWEALGVSPFYAVALAVFALADIAFIISYVRGIL